MILRLTRKNVVCLFLAVGGCSSNAVDNTPLPGPTVSGLTLGALAKTQSINLSSAFGSDDIATIAIFTSPELRAIRAREDVSQAQVFAAGLIPDPSFTLGADYPRNSSGLVTALAASIGLDIAALARRPAAKRAAQAEIDAVRLDIAWAEWLVSEQAKIQAIKIPYLERSNMLTSQLRRLAEEELSRSLEAMMRGDLPAASLETRRLAATDAASRYRESENLLAQARLDLNRTLGLDPGQRIDIATTVMTKSSPSDVADLYLRSIAQRADLKGMRARYEASSAKQSLAVLGGYPLPVVAVNAGRDTGAIRTLGPSVSLALPIWNRGRGELAMANATRAQLRAEYAARLETVRADIASIHTALGIANKQYEEVADDIRPLISQAEAVSRAVERGDLSQSAGMATRLALLDKQIVANGLAMAVAELSIALEIAAGFQLEPQA